jgi:CDP-diacylglycerol--serine O-phosphatidyltransferase
MLAILLAFVLVSFDPPIVLFLLFCCYGVSGYVLWALGTRAKPAS